MKKLTYGDHSNRYFEYLNDSSLILNSERLTSTDRIISISIHDGEDIWLKEIEMVFCLSTQTTEESNKNLYDRCRDRWSKYWFELFNYSMSKSLFKMIAKNNAIIFENDIIKKNQKG